MIATALTPEEAQRYSRHIILPEVGMEGQLKLKAAKVLLVGMGGLGSPSALYLAAAGIGALGIVDFDAVDASNLHRQVIHFTTDEGRPKIESAAEKITAINPNVQVVPFAERLTSKNALEIVSQFDIVLDGADNFPTRYLVNDACVLTGKPNCYGSIFRFDGQASVFGAPGGPCYRCLYPEPPPPGLVPSCAEGGVLGVLPGIVGLVQATEAIKLILGKGESLVGRLLLFDALEMRWREMKIKRDPNCPVCGDNPTVKELIDYEQFCGIFPEEPNLNEIDPQTLKNRMDRGEKLVLLDIREPHELQISQLPGIVHIPMEDVPYRMDELDADAEIVVICRTGNRSAKVTDYLLDQGFKQVYNLATGMNGWADTVDPEVKKY